MLFFSARTFSNEIIASMAWYLKAKKVYIDTLMLKIVICSVAEPEHFYAPAPGQSF
jgi:hypothetical protein